MSDESVVHAVSAANVKAHVEHITTEIPSRLAGSANGKRMAEYSAAALTKSGVSARVHEMPGLVSFPEQAEMRVLAPIELSIEANTLGHSLPTLADGIAGELIDVASGAFGEYDGRDATGKITLSELSYHPARHEKQRISAIMGDRWLDDVTLFGSPTRVRDRIEAWYDAGIRTPILVPSSTKGGQLKAFEEIMATFAG